MRVRSVLWADLRFNRLEVHLEFLRWACELVRVELYGAVRAVQLVDVLFPRVSPARLVVHPLTVPAIVTSFMQVEACTFETGEVYAIDIAMSTGDGKPRDMGECWLLFC
jgi:hypothetical protein